MSSTLTVATILMTLALVSYSVGVWAERVERYLRPWHVAAFWLGLALDAAGTYAMGRLTASLDWGAFHTWTGLSAFLLMAAHALWAAVVVRRDDDRARATFHRFSLTVWLLWLVPYVGGLMVGMTKSLA